MMLEKIHDEVEIAHRIQEVAQKITRAYGNENLLVVGILKGAAVFMGDLMRALPFPCHYDFIQEKRSTEAINRIFFLGGGDWKDFTGNLLLIKDVMHSGVIESYLITQLKNMKVKQVGVACIIDKPSERKVDLVPDFAMFVENEGIFAGYGMEYKQAHGNLPYISRIIGG
jgi:hypoxanthine phosphoribosyltransferase